LNFYAKEQGAKAKTIKFVCLEDSEDDVGDTNQLSVKTSEKKEFAFVHIIERMLQIFWHQFFEKKLGISGKGPDGLEDCYQFHGFILKKNSWKMLQRRFMVLTKKWMFNVECDFNKKTKEVEFKEMKWRHPIKAITKVELTRTDGRLSLTIYFDPDV